jgi:hypothetical protein
MLRGPPGAVPGLYRFIILQSGFFHGVADHGGSGGELVLSRERFRRSLPLPLPRMLMVADIPTRRAGAARQMIHCVFLLAVMLFRLQ